MNTDTIRLIFTYSIALVVLVGSFFLLIIDTPGVSSEAKLPFITGITGLVLGFVFNRESTTAGQRASERAVAQGANAGVMPEPAAK